MFKIEYKEGGTPGGALFVEARLYDGARLVSVGRVEIPTWTYLMHPDSAGEYRGAALRRCASRWCSYWDTPADDRRKERDYKPKEDDRAARKRREFPAF